MQIRRCMKCMHELRAGETVCPVCGREYGTFQTEHFALKPGTILEGKYLVGEMLGQGGFGITYVGFDLLLEQKVAIKEYFPMSTGMVSRDNQTTVVWSTAMMQKTGTEKGFESFLKEARKMAKLRQIPSVVGVNSVFIENETAYIVMDYVEGETLLTKLQREGKMDFETCLRLLTPIMQALAQVHQHGIIHRDISPDNIMVKQDGSLVLLDLGAAKDLEIKNSDGITQHSSQMVAKHGFSPPEQYSTKGNIGPWTDVYAMAATIYYCCTQELPPVAMERVLDDTLCCRPLLQPQEFEVLRHGMEVRIKSRVQTMGDLLTALNGITENAVEKQRQEEAERLRMEEERRRAEEARRQEDEQRRIEESNRRAAEESSRCQQQEQQRRLEEERRKEEEQQKEHREEEKKHSLVEIIIRKKWLFPAAAAVLLVLLLVLYNRVIKPGNQYKQAAALMEQGDYKAAITAFKAMGGYKDSAEQIEECRHLYAQINLSDFEYHSTYAYSDDPTDDALYTAAEFANVIKSGNVRDRLPLGTRIKMIPQSSEITDSAIEFELVAYQHFPLAYSSGMAKTTWLAVNLLDETRVMNDVQRNAGGWRDSELRNWLNEILYPTLPNYWKNLMVPVVVSTTEGDKTQKTVSSWDYLFLPSAGEVNEWYFTSSKYSAYYKHEIPSGAEEQTFTRFKDDVFRTKKLQGIAANWWLRSPAAGSSTTFNYVNNYGTSSSNNANSSYGVCLGFCM